MAKIFKSVIEQFAGFFKLVTFAIVNDHNAGHDWNPERKLQTFSGHSGRTISATTVDHESTTYYFRALSATI